MLKRRCLKMSNQQIHFLGQFGNYLVWQYFRLWIYYADILIVSTKRITSFDESSLCSLCNEWKYVIEWHYIPFDGKLFDGCRRVSFKLNMRMTFRPIELSNQVYNWKQMWRKISSAKNFQIFKEVHCSGQEYTVER